MAISASAQPAGVVTSWSVSYTHLQQQNGWARFVTMQDHYNLIYREEENEMLPLCQRNGVAVIPWSPLARGRLTRPWGETTARLVSDEFGKSLYSTSEENDAQIAGNLADVAEELDASRAQVALAWLLSKPGVAAPIIGPSRQEHVYSNYDMTYSNLLEMVESACPYYSNNKTGAYRPAERVRYCRY